MEWNGNPNSPFTNIVRYLGEDDLKYICMMLICCQVQTCFDEAAAHWSQQEAIIGELEYQCSSQQDMGAVCTAVLHTC